MSKAQRLHILKNNLASNIKQQEDYDNELCFMIWYIEKEFHVGGLIDKDFPAMKLFMYYDKHCIDKYNETMERQSKGTGNGIQTMG